MPIRVSDELPAIKTLQNENIFVMTKSKEIFLKKIRSITILILNLMPKKIETENQFLRLLSNSPLQIDVQFLRIDQHKSKNTPIEHLNRFYCNFTDIQNKKFDGLIITGAPLGLINFDDVKFWPKIKKLIIWAKKHITSILFICWAAQAALQILYNLPKITRNKKLIGIYQHKILNPYSPLTRGFDETFYAPHSRYSEFSKKLIHKKTDLEILAESNDVGIYLFVSPDNQLVFVTGHPEYDKKTLLHEYNRDLQLGLNPNIPKNYFPNNNPLLTPKKTWSSHAHLLISNWIHYYVYNNK